MSRCVVEKQELSLNKSLLSAVERNKEGEHTYNYQLKDFFPYLGKVEYSNRFATIGIAVAGLVAAVAVPGIFAADRAKNDVVTLLVVINLILAVFAFFFFLPKRKKSYRGYMLEAYGKEERFFIPLPRQLSDEQKQFFDELEAGLRRYSGFAAFIDSFSCNCTPECFTLLDQLKEDRVLSEEEFRECKEKRIDEAFRN